MITIPLIALLGAASTSAAPPLPPGATFTLPLVKNDNFQEMTGLDAMLRAYAKFNASLTPQLELAMRINKNHRGGVDKRAGTMWGTVEAVPPNDQDYEYISPVKIGTPPQTVKVAIDTGSADLWVMSSDTPRSQVNGQPLYSPSKSSTSKRVKGAFWSIGYGDDSGASGVVYTDKVALGGATFPSQVVESATWVSPAFTHDVHIAGIMGLGMSSLNTVRPGGALTFMDNIRDRLRFPVFTANLKKGRAGNFNFGYVSPFEHTEPIRYAAIDGASPYWTITADGYAVGAGAGYKAAPWSAIVDTGTTLLLLPDAVVTAYYAQVKGARLDPYQGSMVFPCASALPDFVFGVGAGPSGHRGTVPGRYMNYWQLNRTHCFGGIQSSGGIGFSIFGDVLLKAQFVVFDLGRKMVGFANKKLES